jgi:predicted RNase H-like nuclease
VAGVLGIDAAWTEKEPSGVALLEGSPGEWRCVAVAPSYDSFLSLAEGVSVDWSIKAKGATPAVGQLVAAANDLLGGQDLAAVAVDMPLSTEPITCRREADVAISRCFGSKGCATHTPSADRPGRVSARLRKVFGVAGFSLATSTTAAGEPDRLIEVYPHPALLSLTRANYRVPYKVGRSLRYWQGTSTACRRAKLLDEFEKILAALREEISGILIKFPKPAEVASLRALKLYEDSLDALVCAWVGAKYLEEEAKPYGDHTAAVWVP